MHSDFSLNNNNTKGVRLLSLPFFTSWPLGMYVVCSSCVPLHSNKTPPRTLNEGRGAPGPRVRSPCSILLLPYLMAYYVVSGLFLLFFWCPCMAINVSVQYNGGLLPDIILLTLQCYFHRGTRLNSMKRFCICSLRYNLNAFIFYFILFFFPDWGMLRKSRRVLIFL